MGGRCPLCRWQALVPLLAVVALLGSIAGCALVQRDLRPSSTEALSAAGVKGVSVDVTYRDVVLTGPQAVRERALAAVDAVDGVRGVRFVVAQGGAAADPDVTVRMAGGRVTLTGTVATEDDHRQLLTAARAAVGAGGVDDRLTVSGGRPSPAQEAAVGALVGSVDAMDRELNGATARLVGRRLTLSGQLRTGSNTLLQTAVERATGAGLVVKADFSPAPVAAARPRVVQRRLAGLLRGTTIQFDTASADIRPVSQPVLVRAAGIMVSAMRANAGLRVRVEGHTDNVGDAARNLALSRRRARSVLDFLVGRGVPRARVTAVGYGSSRPVADNTTEAGRLANRRIAFRVVGG